MTFPDDTLRIDTPENVAFGYDIAGIGSRFLAALVDTILITILQAIVILTLILAANNSLDGPVLDIESLGGWILAAAGLLLFFFYWGYYIFFEMIWNGQSPGKRLAGLRVIRTDGTPVTLAESVIRNLVRLVDLLPAFYGIGIMVMFVNDQSRRLGDLAAGTLVVRDRGPVTLASLAAQPDFGASLRMVPAPDQELPVERLSQADLQMAEDFLLRKEKLYNRMELSKQIAHTLWERMGLPEQVLEWPETEKRIAQVVLASRK